MIKGTKSRLKAMISKSRGYKHFDVAGFRLRLAPESNQFDFTIQWHERMTGEEFVRWTDFVQFQIVVKLLESLDAPTVVDVGAHHGLYALLAGAFCKQVKGGRVFAFEPVTENYGILRDNIALNSLQEWVIPIQKAVSDHCASARISRIGSQSRIDNSAAMNSEVVEQVDLRNELPSDLKHINILMIDVEGAELPVLRGFPWERIEVSSIFCEFHPYAWKDFGYTADDMSEFLEAHELQAIDMFQEDQTRCYSEYYVGPTLLKSSRNCRNTIL